MKSIFSLFLLITLAVAQDSLIMDEYLAKPEPVFKWRHIAHMDFKTAHGNQAYILNVTSLEYLDTSKVSGPKGSVWDHEVIVVVPKDIVYKNVSTVYLSGSCKSNNGQWIPRVDEDLIVTDEIAKSSQAVTIVIKQLPNCD